MTGPGPLLDSDDSQAAAEPRVDLAAVESLLQLVVKGLRAIQLYLPNNPVYQQAVANIRNGFAPVWSSTTEDLTLTVRETDFAIGDKVVLSQPAKNESIAWVLFKDGIRQVNLSPGVEEQELVNFLTVINKVRNLPPDAEDDLLTLLWQQDFQHIRYAFVEMGSEDVPSLGAGEAAPKLASGAAPSAGGISRASLESDVRGGGAGEAEAETGGGKPAGVVSMEDFDPTLYFLDDSEVEYLKGEIDREYKQDLRGNVLAILFDLLELQTYSTVRAELISIVENFIPYLLAVGDFRSVALVLRELKVVLQRAREMLPEHRQAMEQLPSRLSQPDALAQLLQSLDEAVVFPSEDELGELFRELKAEALETVFAWLPKLSNQRVRELLDAAAQRLALAYPNEMTKTLGSSDDTIALEAVRLVSRLKLPPAVPALGELLGHENTAVRVAVVEALAAIGSPGALQQLEKALDDGDRDVRLATVRTMTAHGQRSAYAKIEAAVSGKALRMADLTEKVAFFEAYGRLGGPEGVDQLAAMLDAKGGFLKRKEDPETRACAAMALGKIGTEKAKQVLQLAAQDKEPLVRNAANKALRELQ